MKKFRYSTLILAVLLFAAVTAPGQKERFNFGKEWHLWSDYERSIYLVGFVDGQSGTYLALVDDVPKERREPLRLQTFTFYDSDAIRDVMTSLYGDPANTFIRHGSMLYIARDKLSGKDIEARLRQAREQDWAYMK